MNEKRVKDLQESYMAFETSDELVQILIRKNLEPDALEAAKLELEKRGIDTNNPNEKESDVLIQDNATKLCPFCAEEIKFAAVVCRYCNRDIIDTQQQSNNITSRLWTVSIFLGIALSIMVRFNDVFTSGYFNLSSVILGLLFNSALFSIVIFGVLRLFRYIFAGK